MHSGEPASRLAPLKPESLTHYIVSPLLGSSDSEGRTGLRQTCILRLSVSTTGDKQTASGFAHLSGEQSVGIELLQPRHQVVLGVDDVLHEAAGERKPIGAARDLEAFGDAAFAETPHVVVALVEEAVEALLLDEPATQRQSPV